MRIKVVINKNKDHIVTLRFNYESKYLPTFFDDLLADFPVNEGYSYEISKAE